MIANQNGKTFLKLLLPTNADNKLYGSPLPVWILALVAGIGIVRSLIHILAPDGGAGSIAGMDLSLAGSNGVIFAFALWGGEQLVYAIIQWVVIIKYRSLVPFMWAVQILESLTRTIVGQMKPVEFAHTPPGAIQNYIYLPLAVLMLALALWSGSRNGKQTTREEGQKEHWT